MNDMASIPNESPTMRMILAASICLMVDSDTSPPRWGKKETEDIRVSSCLSKFRDEEADLCQGSNTVKWSQTTPKVTGLKLAALVTTFSYINWFAVAASQRFSFCEHDRRRIRSAPYRWRTVK